MLTTLSSAVAALGLLSVATVLSIGPPVTTDSSDEYARYTNGLLAQPGLRPGLATALLLLTLPVLLFVAQCAQLSASARDRRLAGYRMAGATPAQTAWIAATEGGFAAVVGAVLGASGYFMARVLADSPDANGVRPLPTDVLPPAWAIVLVVVCVPALVVALSLLLLRRLVISPFGLVHRTRTSQPARWPVMLLVIGAVMLPLLGALSNPYREEHPTGFPPLAVVAGLVGLIFVWVGLAGSNAWFSHRIGTALRRYARRPTLLLAGGRLTTDPWHGSRTGGVLFIAGLIGGGATAMRSTLPPYQRSNPFYRQAFDLLNLAVEVGAAIAVASLLVALVENIVSRRRELVGSVAAGVPRRSLFGAILVQALLVTVPGTLVALTIGAETMEQYGGTRASSNCHAGDHCVSVPGLHLHLITLLPWAPLAALAGFVALVVLVVTALSLPFLPSSTRIAELRCG
ncbi:FtsX-like permease family protein [Actinocatenispora sera]|uniref:FtsX-like permease family protein n=1 Tax=Actinocatenispora sera TaxID=390989 RepID=UPI0033DE889B